MDYLVFVLSQKKQAVDIFPENKNFGDLYAYAKYFR